MNTEVKKFQEEAALQMAKECTDFAKVLVDEKISSTDLIHLLERHQFRLTFFMDCTKTFKILEDVHEARKQE